MLRNRKENKEPKLVGVNRVTDPIKMKLGSFQSLENFIQAHRYKIKKKRGPEPLVSCAPPPEPPEECTDATPRGQQHLVEELRFTNSDTHGATTRTSWSYISPTEEVYTLVGSGTCAGGNMAYSDTCSQINHFLGAGSPVDNPALVSPDGALAAVNTVLGVSDEPLYHFRASSAFRRLYFPVSNTTIDLAAPFPPSPFGNAGSSFVKRTDRYYGLNAVFGGQDPTNRIWAWSLTDGSFLWESQALGDYTQTNGSATADFLYVLATSGPSFPQQVIARLNIADGSLDEMFILDNMRPRVLFTVNDDLIYILTDAGALYYLENFTNIVFVGQFTTSVTPFNGSGFFTNNRFYYGSNGFGGLSAHIYSIEVSCPDAEPIIASVTTQASVVANGGNIQVDWADVLEPAVNDRLYLQTNDSVLFDTSPVSTSIPGLGTGSGTHSFPIPGGTTPGSYVIQYVGQNQWLIATSAPFTVT